MRVSVSDAWLAKMLNDVHSFKESLKSFPYTNWRTVSVLNNKSHEK